MQGVELQNDETHALSWLIKINVFGILQLNVYFCIVIHIVSHNAKNAKTTAKLEKV